MDPRARSSQVTRATSKPRRTRRSLTKIANADRAAGRTKAPAAPKPAPRPVGKVLLPPAGSPLTPLATPRALAKAKLPAQTYSKVQPLPKARKAGQNLPAGVARTILHAADAVAEDVAKHPIDAAGKAAKSVGEIVKGTAGAALGLPVSAVKSVVDKALHPSPGGQSGSGRTDSAGTIASRMVGGEAKALSSKYGPSYRGEPGARKRLVKQVQKEGPIPTALDLATVIAPASSGAGKILKLGEKARPALKVEPLKDAAKQPTRPSAVGFGITKAHDTARAGVQKVAVARSTQRLRTRVPGVKAHTEPGRKPSILNTEPKPLTARRATLRPGEVAPVSEKAANRTLRRHVAEQHTRGKAVGNYRVQRHVTGKGPESLRASFKGLPDDLHHAALTAAQLGIKDATGAASIIPLRIAEIAKSRAAAAARTGKLGKKDAAAEAHAQGAAGELDQLKSYLANPSVFDHPGVQAAADAVRRRPVGAREGLSADRAAQGRSALVGRTLGVKPAAELNAEAKAAHAADVAKAQAAADAKRAEVVALQRKVSTGRATTREAAIGAGVKVRVGDTATLKAIGRNAAKQQRRSAAAARRELRAAEAEVRAADRNLVAMRQNSKDLSANVGGRAGGVGVRQAEDWLVKARTRLTSARAAAQPRRLTRVAATAEPLVRDAAGLRVAKQELGAARKQAASIRSAAPALTKESGVQYEQRVTDAAAARNLAAPEYVPSKFEQQGLPGDRGGSTAAANPLGQKRSGTLYRLGREHKELGVVEQGLSSSLKRGAQKQAEAHILGQHGLAFANEQAARDFAHGLGLNTDRNLGKVDVAIHSPTGGEVLRGQAPARVTPKGRPMKSADAGNYVKTDSVFLLPKAVKDELTALKIQADTPASALQKLAHYPQAALLALSPSWFQFQRVNDAVAATLGGSAHHTIALEKLRRSLDPDSREILHMMAGGSISSEMLTPFSAQKIGRMQRFLDGNPVYQKAFGGQNPATALLRADQAITHGVRERQLLHNLSIVARKMDPDVAAVQRAFGPIGHAFKTADAELAMKLLKDPRYAAQLEDAAQRLYKIHGDWHNYTAREQRLKHYAAFYGFLRYATRMALYTLPVQHPYVGMLIGQLGEMGARDAKAIIGPDIPYGLGALYNTDGTINVDFTRANPLLGPLFSIDKPEQAVGLATPLAGLTLSYLLGQPIGLNDSSGGRIKQYTVGGDPTNHAVGGFTGTPRLRIASDQLLSLLSPYREWKKFDGRQQSSDSLAFSRKYLASTTAAGQVPINEKNKNSAAGLGQLAHDIAPLAFPGSSKNVKAQGDAIAAAKRDAAGKSELNAAKRHAALDTPVGRAQREIDLVNERIKSATSGAQQQIDDINRKIELARIRAGG